MPAATTHQTRREFFFGRSDSNQAIRPVGAINGQDFHDVCKRCGACARACPEQIIQTGSGGYPFVDFAKGSCTFCHACIEACETGALVADADWPYRATVADSCLSLNAVQCRVCQDHCDRLAIRFRLAPGGRSRPLIAEEDCTGCGACVAPCPVHAITIQPPTPQQEVHS